LRIFAAVVLAAFFTGSVPASSGVLPVVTPQDYPLSALRAGHEGTVRFELTIGTDGRVTGCRITESSGYSDLDRATCRLMEKRARFQPARDANGNPVEDTYRSFLDWKLAG
jgi:protein TonB